MRSPRGVPIEVCQARALLSNRSQSYIPPKKSAITLSNDAGAAPNQAEPDDERLSRSLACSAQPYLVDPASNHMLVSKIKPCMSKYKPRTRRDCGRLIKSVMTPLGPDSPVDNVR